jgi:hypothetical protein
MTSESKSSVSAHSSDSMERMGESRLSKKILENEVKKSNKLVRKIKLGNTIFDEPDFRESFKLDH